MCRRLGTLASTFFNTNSSVTVFVLLAIVLGAASGPLANAQEVVTHPSRVYSYGQFRAFAYSPDEMRDFCTLESFGLGWGISNSFAPNASVGEEVHPWYVDLDNVSGVEDGTSWATAFTNIQAAVDAAFVSGGGEVWVAEGTYTATINPVVTMKENVHIYGGFAGLRSGGNETDLSQRDRITHVAIIDGENSRRCVIGANIATLDGFRLERGLSDAGAGMYNSFASPVVSNCVFFANQAYTGGGMYNVDCSPTVTGCIFRANGAGYQGGGMENRNAACLIAGCIFQDNSAAFGAGMNNEYGNSPTVVNCVFARNVATTEGGGMGNGQSSPTVTNCVFVNNRAPTGGGVNNWYGSPTLTNCILWGDVPEEIFEWAGSYPLVTYSDIQGGYPGTGNIDLDPLFRNSAVDDFRLEGGSPCIDAGTSNGAPSSDILGNPRPQGRGIDMGAYEGASRQAEVIQLGGSIEVQALPFRFYDYQLNLDSENVRNLVVRLTPLDGSGDWTLIGRSEQLPLLALFDWTSTTSTPSGTTELLIPAAQAGTYYLSVYYRDWQGASPTGRFQLETIPVDQYLSSLDGRSGGASGTTTVQVFGLGFGSGVHVELRTAGGEAVRSFNPSSWNATSMTVTMDLTGLAGGAYDVAVVWPGAEQTLPQAFTINAVAIGPRLESHLEAPSPVRPGRPYTLWLDYANTGDADVPAPLFIVTSPQVVSFRLNPEDHWQAGPVQILGVNPVGAAGVLSPGAHHRIPIYFLSVDTAMQFNLERLTADATAVDWNAIGAEVRPEGYSDEAWSTVWSNFTSQTGTTWADYLGRLDADATSLALQGRLTYDVRELIAYELADANAATGGGPVLAAALDAQCPATALPLAFARTCGASLDRRLRIGPLGRGWSHNFQYALTFPSADSAVVLGPGGFVRRFTRPSGGAWQGELGDHGFLESLQDGTYKLSEPDGVSFAFSAAGQLTSVREPNGNVVTLTYSGEQLTGIAHSNGGAFTLDYNAQGRIRQLTDQAGKVTTYSYDGSGEQLIAVTAPGSVTTGYSYVSASGPTAHALQTVTFPDGTHEYFGYDPEGRLTGRWLDGNAARVDVAYGGPGSVTATDATGATSRFFYGPSGELLRFQDPLGGEVRSQYDRALNLTRLTLPDGSVSELRYDDRGHLIHSIDPLGNSISSGYTARPERLDWLRDPNGNLTDFTYDATANLARTTYPNGGYEQFGYAAGGNMTSYMNRRWQTFSFTYNERGQVTRKTYPDGRSNEYAYDDTGRLIAATDMSGTTVLQYDARGFLSAIQYPSGHGFIFSYNNAGQRVQRVGDDGYALNYEYDANGRLARLSDGGGAELVHYEYDAAGRLSQEIKGNGTFTTYGYDGAGHVTSLVNYAPGGAVQSRFDYTYDVNGNPISMTTLDGVTSYEYDAIGQLAGVTFPGGRHVVYEYDASGNRTRVIDNGVTTVYTTNNLNQYTKAGDTTYAFDGDGNMTSKTDTTGTTTYQYDEENRLIKVVSPTGDTWDYTFDALGNRAAVTHNGETTSYVHDPIGFVDVAAEYDAAGNLAARNIHGAGLVARESADGKVGYYAFDATGHTRQVSETDGVIANEYDYDPFGALLAQQETVQNPFLYVGRFGVATQGNGLLFMRARHYEPELGRFISTDPKGVDFQSQNLYLYSHNSPMEFVDPNGEVSLYVAISAAVVYTAIWLVPRYGPVILQEVCEFLDPNPSGSPQGKFGGFLGMLWEFWQQYGPSSWPDSQRGRSSIPTPGDWHNPNWDPPDWRDPRNYHFPHFPNSPEPPGSQRTPAGSVPSFPVQAIDPNEKVSPRGTGTEAERFIPADAAIPYTVYFENVSTASAAAQVVVVTDYLDPDLDASTFRLSGIVWGDHEVTIPEGTSSFYARETVMDYRPGVDKSWWVDVTVDMDYGSGRVQWTFETLDPETGELPTDVYAGFLPPNDGTHRGEGHVVFTVVPKTSLDPGTRIANTASIVFDTNAPIATNEVFNTIETPAANQPPVLTNPGEQPGTEGQPTSLQLQATDPDNDTLTFGAQGLPTGLSINPFTGLISGTLDSASAGVHTVTATVSDGELEDSEQFTWTVAEGVGVPDVVGMTQANAQTAILAVGLTVGTVTEQYSATVAAGLVIEQDPASGSLVLPGSTINLVVSKSNGCDLDGSGKVNATDVQMVINRALGRDIGSIDADVNGDARVNAMDVQMVINAALGRI